jgi:hypothetical protein
MHIRLYFHLLFSSKVAVLESKVESGPPFPGLCGQRRILGPIQGHELVWMVSTLYNEFPVISDSE